MSNAYILIILLIIDFVNVIEVQDEKRFDILVKISKQHFYPDEETYLIDNLLPTPYPYFKELCKVFSENWPLVIIGDNYTKMFPSPARRGINNIFTNYNLKFNYELTYKASPMNKNIIYFDLREDYTCSRVTVYLKFNKFVFWNLLFQSIILIHYQKNCSNEYEMLTAEPWLKKSRKITRIKDAYFNRKPNMHGTVFQFHSSIQERYCEVHGCEKGSKIENQLENFKNIWFEKWNMIDNHAKSRKDLISVIYAEPARFTISADAYSIISMCFVVQKGKERPKWEAIIWCFHWKVWLSLSFVWLISGLAWFFIMKKKSFLESLHDVYKLIISESVTWLPNLKSNLARCLAGVFTLASIIFITGFQSNLYKNMQVPLLYPPVNEIKQIKDLNLSIVCTFSYSCLMIFGKLLIPNYSNDILDKLLISMSGQVLSQGKYLHFRDQWTLNDVFKNPNLALITPCESARLMINKIPKFSKKLHLVEETISLYPLYFENFPFIKRLRKLLLEYLECGIGQWSEQLGQWNKLMKILLKEKQEPLVRVFNMDDLQIGFIILFIGLSISTFVFILECMSNYWPPQCRLWKKFKFKRERMTYIN